MKNNRISNVITTIVLALLLSFSSILAQYDNTDENTNTQNQGNQQDQTRTDQDQTGTGIDNMMGNDQGEEAFRQTALQLANDLIARVNLQQDKSEDIADILVDYRNNIADIKQQHKNDMTGMTGTDDVTGTGTTGEGTDMTGTDQDDQTRTEDQTGVTDGDDESMVGGTEGTNLQDAYREADMDANEKVEDAIGEENIQQYLSIKREWWSDVKDKVHASLSATGTMNNEMNNQMDNQGTGSGTGTDVDEGSGTGTDDATGTENR